jgi:hypothetical protein
VLRVRRGVPRVHGGAVDAAVGAGGDGGELPLRPGQ